MIMHYRIQKSPSFSFFKTKCIKKIKMKKEKALIVNLA